MKTKIKNLVKNLRGYIGYVSLFMLFVIVVILVISGFYGWQKYQEKKFPELAARGEIKGPSYYLKMMKMKIEEILESKDTRNNRAMELAEEGKTIRDKANFYQIEVPASWVTILSEGAKGNQISNLVVQSSYFSGHEDSGIKYYDAGAKFSARITQGEDRTAISGAGGHATLIKKGDDISAGGEETVYHIFKDADSKNGEIIDAHFIHNGNTYLFTMIYNPKTFTDAEYAFREILYSLTFKN